MLQPELFNYNGKTYHLSAIYQNSDETKYVFTVYLKVFEVRKAHHQQQPETLKIKFGFIFAKTHKPKLLEALVLFLSDACQDDDLGQPTNQKDYEKAVYVFGEGLQTVLEDLEEMLSNQLKSK